MTRLEILASAVRATERPLYFETTPLFEERWTGIPIVTAGLTGALLANFPNHIKFFHQIYEVAPDIVADALVERNGGPLRQAFAMPNNLRPLTGQAARRAAAIFPSVKPIRNTFAIESSLVYDLSPLVTPQFHQPENIGHHVTSIQPDRQSNHVTFAISQATADDLAAYFGDDGRTFVVRPGFAWPAKFVRQAAKKPMPYPGAPYFLLLGTREPRKNLRLVLRTLRLFPDLLDQARVIIVGKNGWDLEAEGNADFIAEAEQKGKLIFTGYVGEFEKFQLLRGAVALIYPSFFEGFGLPVLESLSVGTPCVASFSAAIPEAGGAYCRYFDPFSVESLSHAMREMLGQAANGSRKSARAALRQAVAAQSWDAMLEQMLEKLLPLMAKPNECKSVRRQCA